MEYPKNSITERAHPVTLARITDPEGVIMLNGDGGDSSFAGINAVYVRLFDLDGPDPKLNLLVAEWSDVAVAANGAHAIDEAQVFQAALMTDLGWSKGAPGYNFRHSLATESIAIGGHTYRVEYEIEWTAFDEDGTADNVSTGKNGTQRVWGRKFFSTDWLCVGAQGNPTGS